MDQVLLEYKADTFVKDSDDETARDVIPVDDPESAGIDGSLD